MEVVASSPRGAPLWPRGQQDLGELGGLGWAVRNREPLPHQQRSGLREGSPTLPERPQHPPPGCGQGPLRQVGFSQPVQPLAVCALDVLSRVKPGCPAVALRGCGALSWASCLAPALRLGVGGQGPGTGGTAVRERGCCHGVHPGGAFGHPDPGPGVSGGRPGPLPSPRLAAAQGPRAPLCPWRPRALWAQHSRPGGRSAPGWPQLPRCPGPGPLLWAALLPPARPSPARLPRSSLPPSSPPPPQAEGAPLPAWRCRGCGSRALVRVGPPRLPRGLSDRAGPGGWGPLSLPAATRGSATHM